MNSNYNKYILIALTVASILLIGITTLNDRWLTPLRTGLGMVLIPIQSGMNYVGMSIYENFSDYTKLKDAVAMNKTLQDEIDRLKEENNRLLQEQFELARLRELLELDQEYMQYEKVGARVIANNSDEWFQVFRVDKGFSDGVEVDNNVLSGGGLVGIVTDVGANYATVRAIIDDSSRVSAMAIQSGDTCIVGGDLTLYKEGRLSVTNIKKGSDIKDGDRLVTSNISSKFLPGILIGYVTGITVDSNQLTSSGYLVPAADFQNIQEVLIITQQKEDAQ
jgi:rod shape-determining protein MreC